MIEDQQITDCSCVSRLEGNYVGAEPHLLAAGKRDSARLLAQNFHEWAEASNPLTSHAGAFALRGTIPSVYPYLCSICKADFAIGIS